MALAGPGAVVTLPEAAYLYGQGPLVMRVDEIQPSLYPDWVWVTGREILYQGAPGNRWRVLALASALRVRAG